MCGSADKYFMRKNGIFLVSILLSLLFWQWAYFEFKGHYSGLTEAHNEIESLHQQMERTRVKTELTQYQFDLFKQQVATRIPEVIDRLDPIRQNENRSLASVLQKPNDEYLTLAQFDTAIDEMKSLFEQRKYPNVIRKGQMILEQNPISASLVTVYFMLAESYFQINEFDSCFNIAEQMISLFPESPKTGYVMLRVGIFLKEKNRVEEARNMFALVSKAFAGDKNLKYQSEKLLADLESIEGGKE